MRPPAALPVLVVDDEEGLRGALVEDLKRRGYGVTPAATGQEALEALRAVRYDVVVTDLGLPDLDGLAVMERTRLMQPDAVVILMTGQGTVDSAVRAIKGGAYDYILKPFSLDEFARVVSRGLEERRLRQENLELGEVNRRLQEVEQLKSDLLSAVTHEFRTPLTIINGWVSLLLEQRLGRLTNDQQEGLAAVKHGSERLGRLIANLLTYLESDRGELSLAYGEVRLLELVPAVLRALEPEIKDRGLTVRLDLDPGMPACRLDPERATILLSNLIENAVKFNVRQGEVLVAAQAVAGELEVTIGNSGGTIPPERVAALMQPFTQGDMSRTRPAGGLGLGLAVARAIVDACRGHMAIESGAGGGTTVRVRLPVWGAGPAARGGG